jgi:hypothetical protein
MSGMTSSADSMQVPVNLEATQLSVTGVIVWSLHVE